MRKMPTKYTKINNSYEARTDGEFVYVRTTGMNHMGLLVAGERVGTIYRMPYTKDLEHARNSNLLGDEEYHLCAIDRCTMGGAGEIIKQGRLIR